MNDTSGRLLRLGAVFAVLQISALPQTALAAGLRATEWIALRGNSIFCDSFNSADPFFSTDGQYDPAKNNDRCDLVVLRGLTNSLNAGNAGVMGRLRTGPGTNTIMIGPAGSVGDKDWVQLGTKGVQPGWAAADVTEPEWGDVFAPAVTWMPAIPGSYDINGLNYEYVFETDGYFTLSSLSGRILVRGSNTVVNLKLIGNLSSLLPQGIRVGPSATLRVYIEGESFYARGEIESASGAGNLFLFGLHSTTNISLGSSFTGCIYAPAAAVDLGGGGATTNHFTGTCVAKTISVNGHIGIHFDEMLETIRPAVTLQPRNQSVIAGQDATFSVSAGGTWPLAYQWRFNSDSISEATNSLLTITNASFEEAGGYSVVITNVNGSVTSSPATLTVYASAAATISSPFVQQGNQFQFAVQGVSGFKYAVHGSTNLVEWIPLETNTAPFIFSDPGIANSRQQFYRVLWVP